MKKIYCHGISPYPLLFARKALLLLEKRKTSCCGIPAHPLFVIKAFLSLEKSKTCGYGIPVSPLFERHYFLSKEQSLQLCVSWAPALFFWGGRRQSAQRTNVRATEGGVRGCLVAFSGGRECCYIALPTTLHSCWMYSTTDYSSLHRSSTIWSNYFWLQYSLACVPYHTGDRISHPTDELRR